MKVIFLTEDKKFIGGGAKSVRSLIIGLANYTDMEVVCLCQPSSSYIHDPEMKNVRIITTSQDWHIGWNLLWIKSLFSVNKILKKELTEDAYVITNNTGGAMMTAFLPRTNGREIYVNRGGFLEGLVGKVVQWRIRSKRIYYTICVSSMQQSMIKSHCPNISNIRVIHNGIIPPDKPMNFPLMKGKTVQISVVGAISKNKNQETGVKMLKLLLDEGFDVNLNIFGIASTEQDKLAQKDLEKLIDDLQVRSKIRFYGYQSQEIIFSNTDILVSFSLSEGFGRTLVEAQLNKRPVIAFRGARGPIDITDDGLYGFLVQECTPTAYARVIKFILSNDDEVRFNTEAAYHYAMNNFTEKIYVENYYNFFKSLDIKN